MASLLLLTLIKSLPPVPPAAVKPYVMKPLEVTKAKRFASLMDRIEKTAKEVREAAFVQHLRISIPRAEWAHLNEGDKFITARREALVIAQQAEAAHVRSQVRYYGLRSKFLPH